MVLVGFASLSTVGTILNLWLADIAVVGHVKGAIFRILLASWKYWAMLFIVIVSTMLPLYLIKQLRRAVGTMRPAAIRGACRGAETVPHPARMA